jgi:tryptophan synthase alpha chain
MTSVSSCFQSLRARQQCALIPFLTAGDPNLETTAQALQALDRAGADLIELGVPYSDPLADGPTIQAAATRALQAGVKLEDVLQLVEKVSPTIQAPIILFTYYNPILNLGIEEFLHRIKKAGAQGLVVPDLPLEESAGLLETAARIGIEVILLVAPTSPPERQKAIAHSAQGFVYLVSVTGVTGMRTGMGDNLGQMIAELKKVTDKPIAVGFGISDPAQAQQVKELGADGVIVGSAMVKKLAAEGIPALEQFCRELKAAITSSGA